MLDKKSIRLLKKLKKSKHLSSTEINDQIGNNLSTESLYGDGYIQNVSVDGNTTNPQYSITQKGADVIYKRDQKIKSTVTLIISIINTIGVVTTLIYQIATFIC